MARLVSKIVAIPRWWVVPFVGATKALLWVAAPFSTDSTIDRIVDRAAGIVGNRGFRFEDR